MKDKKDREGSALLGCTYIERGGRKARSKEMSANNYQDHPSTDFSHVLFSLSLPFFRLLNLRVLFFVGISYFLKTRRTAIIVPEKRTTRRITKTSWE